MSIKNSKFWTMSNLTISLFIIKQKNQGLEGSIAYSLKSIVPHSILGLQLVKRCSYSSRGKHCLVCYFNLNDQWSRLVFFLGLFTTLRWWSNFLLSSKSQTLWVHISWQRKHQWAYGLIWLFGTWPKEGSLPR